MSKQNFSQKILNENCIIQAPDGVNLTRCGSRKIKWYLDRNLAVKTSDNPLTIKLNFEPSGRLNVNDEFILSEKPNHCIVCGSLEKLSKHHIIPYNYIRCLPQFIKVESIKDIFPLCVKCHDKYEIAAYNLKIELAKKHTNYLERAAIISASKIINLKDKKSLSRKTILQCDKWYKNCKDYLGHEPTQAELTELAGKNNQINPHLRAYARTLLKENIPDLKKEEYLGKCREHLGYDPTHEELVTLANSKIIDSLTDYKEFSSWILNYIKDYADYDSFACMWREHFVKIMNPQYLPKLWTTDRKTLQTWW